MRFKVSRTSIFGEDKPCAEAEAGTIQRWDVRTCKSPEEFDATVGARYGEKWHAKGTEHRLVLGPRGGVHGIERRMDDGEAWFVDIDSLDALMAFRRKYGDIVLRTASDDGQTPELEIYDDYRE